jgi:hypothetical protein
MGSIPKCDKSRMASGSSVSLLLVQSNKLSYYRTIKKVLVVNCP